MQKKQGEYLATSRVKINYTGKKPKITFSYPNLDEQYNPKYKMFLYIFTVWLLLLLLFTFIPLAVQDIFVYLDPFGKGNESVKRYNTCSDFYTVNFDEIVENTCEIYSVNKSKRYVNYNLGVINERSGKVFDVFIILKLAIILLPPVFIYFPFRRRWDSLYPKIQSWGQDTWLATFKSKDVNDKNYVELPFFRNIKLSYNATEDFSKYLQNMEIKEHPFNYLVKKGKKTKKMVNENFWYARFYFSQKPLSGKLDVEFI